MKYFSFIIFVFATLLFSQLSAYADEQAILYLSPQLTPIVGKNMNVNVLIKDIPLVYGVGFQLNIDSEYLEVVDVDNNEAGIQIQAGDFFSTYAYFFNNNASSDGIISYAMTQLNPSESVQGSGIVARITFKCKKAGLTTLRLTKGQFGTRDGSIIIPDIESEKTIQIRHKNGDFNGDSLIDITDSIISFQVLTSFNNFNLPQGTNISDFDINLDGKIGMEEVIYSLRALSGLLQ